MESGNHFFFKAPFRTHFSLQEGNVLAAGSEYRKFWQKVEDADLGKLNSDRKYKIEYIHNVNVDNSLQFESVAEDSNVSDIFSPQIMQITADDWFTEKINDIISQMWNFFPAEFKDKIKYVPSSFNITLFKNTIGNLDLLFELNLSNNEINIEFINSLEDWTNELARKIIKYIYDDFIFPLIKNINKISENHNFTSPVYKHYGFPDIVKENEKQLLFKRKAKCAIPLWVSRVLLIDKIDNGFESLVKRWIISTKSKDDIIENFKLSKYDEKNSVYLGWMHSLFTTNASSNVFEDAKQALSLVQYYYAVLDSINMNLSQIIGISHKKKSINETQKYKKLLEEMVFISNLNEIEFSDVTQSMQRNRAYFLKDLIDKWTLDSLFENVDKKINLCKENINKIYQKAFNKSQRVAELLLFFISGFAILEFLKGLSEFFWSPDKLDSNIWGLYSLGKIFNPNIMLWIGIIVFLVLFIIYTKIINRQK